MRSGRTEKLMSFSAKLFAYCPRPSFSSQSATCCIAAAPRIIRASSARIGQTTRQILNAVDAPTRWQTGVFQELCDTAARPGEGRPCVRPMTGPPLVVIAEAAPAALAGANRGRSPKLKPHRHCRSGSVTSRRVGPPRTNGRASRPARAAPASSQLSRQQQLRDLGDLGGIERCAFFRGNYAPMQTTLRLDYLSCRQCT